MTIQTVRKKPIKFQTVQWSGFNFSEVWEFTGGQFHVMENSDQGFTAEVYDYLHDAWIPVHNGAYIMKGLEGEHYPVKQEVFEATYDILGQSSWWTKVKEFFSKSD